MFREWLGATEDKGGKVTALTYLKSGPERCAQHRSERWRSWGQEDWKIIVCWRTVWKLVWWPREGSLWKVFGEIILKNHVLVWKAFIFSRVNILHQILFMIIYKGKSTWMASLSFSSHRSRLWDWALGVGCERTWCRSPHAFFIPIPLPADRDGHMFKMAESSARSWMAVEQKPLAPNTHLTCHLTGLLHSKHFSCVLSHYEMDLFVRTVQWD